MLFLRDSGGRVHHRNGLRSGRTRHLRLIRFATHIKMPAQKTTRMAQGRQFSVSGTLIGELSSESFGGRSAMRLVAEKTLSKESAFAILASPIRSRSSSAIPAKA